LCCQARKYTTPATFVLTLRTLDPVFSERTITVLARRRTWSLAHAGSLGRVQRSSAWYGVCVWLVVTVAVLRTTCSLFGHCPVSEVGRVARCGGSGRASGLAGDVGAWALGSRCGRLGVPVSVGVLQGVGRAGYCVGRFLLVQF